MDFTFAEREAVSCTVSCKGGRMQGANPCPQFLERGERMAEPKYIDANKVIDYANQEITAAFYYPQGAQEQRKQDEQAYRDKWAFVKQIMVGTPAADVMEVRHGRWLHLHLEPDDITGHTKGECSICGKLRIVDNYCPNCGSRMDLDEVEE